MSKRCWLRLCPNWLMEKSGLTIIKWHEDGKHKKSHFGSDFPVILASFYKYSIWNLLPSHPHLRLKKSGIPLWFIPISPYVALLRIAYNPNKLSLTHSTRKNFYCRKISNSRYFIYRSNVHKLSKIQILIFQKLFFAKEWPPKRLTMFLLIRGSWSFQIQIIVFI